MFLDRVSRTGEETNFLDILGIFVRVFTESRKEAYDGVFNGFETGGDLR